MPGKLNRLSKGFTLIELLIVIAVLGILAVAVLSAINPIEQINRSRDTGSRSDAEQLLGAIDRYYATNGYYPWRSGASSGSDLQAMVQIDNATDWIDDAGTPVLEKLSGSTEGTGELKSSFTSRITSPQYNFLYVYNGGESGYSTYICFNGKSKAFQTESGERCAGTRGAIPDDLPSTNVCAITIQGITGTQNLTCLP